MDFFFVLVCSVFFPRYLLNVLMHTPSILYSLLSRPTNAQHLYIYIYIYIYICTYIYKKYFKNPMHRYMFRYIHIISRES